MISFLVMIVAGAVVATEHVVLSVYMFMKIIVNMARMRLTVRQLGFPGWPLFLAGLWLGAVLGACLAGCAG